MQKSQKSKQQKNQNLIVRYWHKLSSPQHFDKISQKISPWLWIISFILITIGIYMGLFVVPSDYVQGDVFRIIYIHVPTSILSMGIYVSMAIAGSIYFIWHLKLAAYYCRAIAILGACFTFLALFTGAIWGKPTWGTYWSWDARLTSELILLFLYFGYIALVSAIEQEELANKIGSILLITGVINIPIIHFSVVWWNSLHQGATIIKVSKSSIDSSMISPLLICIIGFTFFTAAYAFVATRIKIIEARNEKIQLRNLNS